MIITLTKYFPAAFHYLIALLAAACFASMPRCCRYFADTLIFAFFSIPYFAMRFRCMPCRFDFAMLQAAIMLIRRHACCGATLFFMLITLPAFRHAADAATVALAALLYALFCLLRLHIGLITPMLPRATPAYALFCLPLQRDSSY